jgi:LuxR family transcriptional regulator, maltose regulon positive regulatory protein
MAIALLATKLHIPRPRPELVARPRLSERLDAGLACQLTLVSTPAGFGKTTLLSGWAAHCGAGVAWLSLDEGDNDPVRFLAHLFAGLQTIDGCLGTDALAALQSPQPPSLEELLIGFINQLSAFPAPCVLILDDYHLIEAAAVHSLVAFLLDHQPAPLHLVLAARADPPLPLARLRAAGQLVELRLKDLRFTSAETAEFLGRVVGPALTGEAAQLLTARTEGWIAGLQMAAVSIQDREAEHIDRFIRSFTGSSHFVLDYLAEEVLQRLPPHLQSFLLQTSILDRLSGPLCDALLSESAAAADAPPRSQAILDQLEHANLFLIPLDDEQCWYRYHQLFADLLRQRLQQTEPALPSRLRRRASEWHEANGLITEAISYALAAEDFERAVRLIEQAAEATLKHSEVMTFLGWMEKLPDKLIQARPLLCVYHAWVLLLNGYPLETIEARLESAEGSPDVPSAKTVSVRAFLALYKGETAPAIALARQALEQLPENDTFQRSLSALTLGVAQLSDGDAVASQHALNEATRLSHRTGNVLVAVSVLVHLAESCRKQGQLDQAQQLYQQALERATEASGRRRPIASRALIGLGELAREQNDLEAAARLLTEGLDLTEQWGQISAFAGYLSLARLRQARGDFASAGEALLKARQLAMRTEATELDDFVVELYQAWLWIAQGNLGAARQWAERRGFAQTADLAELERREDFVTYHLRKYEYLVLARLWLAEGRAARAQALLEQLLPNVEKLNRIGLVIETHLLRALALRTQGHVERARQAVERALILAAPRGYVRLFLDEGETSRRLISDSRDSIEKAHPELKGYLEKLVVAWALPVAPGPAGPPKTPHLKAPILAEPLSERELGVLRLLATPLSAAEIADELCVAVSTVRSHTKSIYAKLGTSGRLQAVEQAKALGLL